MSVYYQDEAVTVLAGDCLEVMDKLPAESVHAIVTDPPYGLGFMGKEWDGLPPGEPWARECLRVLKPGGHLLAFGGSRTWHRLAVAVEDAGFEVRDSIAWLYGSGFPKSLDVSKAIDKANGRTMDDRLALGRHIRERREALGHTRAEVNRWLDAATKAEHYESDSPGFARVPTLADWRILRERLDLSDEHLPLVERVEAEREVVGSSTSGATAGMRNLGPSGIKGGEYDVTAPATPDAERWQGWGTALKPAFEPIVVARKPLTGTVAGNVLEHGTGALNVDGCRVGDEGGTTGSFDGSQSSGVFAANDGRIGGTPAGGIVELGKGRWPTNVLLDDTQAAELDRQSGASSSRIGKPRGAASGDGWGMTATGAEYDDEGGASRFFPTFRYEAKAPTDQRPRVNGIAHPTVKPLDLMRWLVRLVTPPGGTVLDPFAGSGTTLEAALIEGFESIGIEREADYLPLIKARLAKPLEAVLDLGALT